MRRGPLGAATSRGRLGVAARRGLLGAAIGLVTGLLVLAPVLGRGVVLSYDMVFVPDPPITGAVLGTDGSVPRAVPTELLADLLARVLPVAAVEQGLLLAAFVLAGAGAARLVPGLPGAAAAALGYAWTPYVAERLLIGHWPFLLGYGLLPWVVHAALAARRGGSLRPLLLWLAAAAAAGATSALIATATALCVVGRAAQLPGGADDAQTTTGGVVGDRPIQPRYRPTPPPRRTPPGRGPHPPRVERHALRLRPVARFAGVVGFAAVVNLPWIVPALARPGGVPADPAGVAAFAARPDTPLGLAGSLLTLGGIWNPATVPAGRDSALAVVALIGVVAALVLGLRPVLADSRGLVAAGAGGLVLATAGALPGLDAVLRAVVVHGPGGGLLRDGQKLLAPAALVVALAAGHAVDRLARAPRTAPWAVLLAILPVLALPGLALGVGGRLTAARYPADWQGLRAAVAQAPPGQVAALPWGTYRRLDWAGDRVVLDPLPRLLDRRTLADDALPLSTVTVRGEDPLAARVSAGLAAGGRLPDVLRSAGVRYAAVHRTQPGSAGTERALAGLPVLFTSRDLLLVELPGPVAPTPADRPWLAVVGLGAAAAGVGALIAPRRRRLLRSRAPDERTGA